MQKKLIKHIKNKKKQKNKEALKNIGETILDFTPIIGDIKGVTYDPYIAYKDAGGGLRGIGYGGLSAGLGLIGFVPGVGDFVSKIGKQSLKFANKQLNKVVSKGLFTQGNGFHKPFSKKGYTISPQLDNVANANADFWSNTEFLQADDYISRHGYGSYGIFIPNTGDIAISLPERNKILKNTTDRKLAGTMYHEVVHRNSNYPSNTGTTLTTYIGGLRSDGKARYHETNMKTLANLERHNAMNFPMLKRSGYWEGSPEELLAEYSNLASRGYVHNGKLSTIGKRALAGRFDLTTSEVDDVLRVLNKNNELEFIPYFRNNKYTNKEFLFDMIDGYSAELSNAAKASIAIGLPITGLGVAINEAVNKNKQ